MSDEATSGATRSELESLRLGHERIVRRDLRNCRGAVDAIARVAPHLPEAEVRTDTIPAIFGRTHDENFLSEYLAYVLDPARNGIGTEPLRQAFRLAGLESQTASFNRVDVNREYHLGQAGRIDLLIIADDHVLGIENKIFSGEGENQTVRYAEAITNEFPEHQTSFLYLTIEGAMPSSESFASCSWESLHGALAEIHYPWTNDIRRGVLWEDFLAHIEEYVSMSSVKTEWSEKAKLYMEHFRVVQEVRSAYETDAKAWFQKEVEALHRRLPGHDWELNFKDSKGWQQASRKSWARPGLDIHFEYVFGIETPVKGSFLLALDVEGGKANVGRFNTLFEERLPALEGAYEAANITYRPPERGWSVAAKKFEVENGCLEEGGCLAAACEEFSFLVDVVGDVIDVILKEENDDATAG